MLNQHQFIERYFAAYLEQSRRRNPFLIEDQLCKIPPSSLELEVLISHLSEHGVDFVIADTLAAIKHLELSLEDIHNRLYRPMSTVVLFISQKQPPPLTNWQEIEDDFEHALWASPSQGYVKFCKIENIKNIAQDPESKESKCPVVDFTTLFKMNLNCGQERDLLDLLSLARVVGIPEGLESEPLNDYQNITLNLVKRWLKIIRENKR